jgi:hypothetical protein
MNSKEAIAREDLDRERARHQRLREALRFIPFAESSPPPNRLLLVTNDVQARDEHGELKHCRLVRYAGRIAGLTHWRLALPEGVGTAEPRRPAVIDDRRDWHYADQQEGVERDEDDEAEAPEGVEHG